MARRGTPLAPDADVQNGDTPVTVTVLLLAAGQRDSSRASVSSSIAVPTGVPHWQDWLVDAVTSRAREGAVRLGAQLAPQGALSDHRFVPLAAVVPTAHVTH
jgi:hypothetical protein